MWRSPGRLIWEADGQDHRRLRPRLQRRPKFMIDITISKELNLCAPAPVSPGGIKWKSRIPAKCLGYRCRRSGAMA
jgi:hypothetical protein